MPQLVTVRVTRRDRRTIRVWVPVLPMVLVLSPLFVLAVVGAVVACHIFHVRVGPALRAVGRFIAALPGTRFDIEEGRTAVLVTIR